MLSSQNCEPLPGFCGKRFLTTYLTITGFGAHGDSGDESSKEQLFRNKRCQKGAEIVRKKFPEFFGSRMLQVRVLSLGPKSRNGITPFLLFDWKHAVLIYLIIYSVPVFSVQGNLCGRRWGSFRESGETFS